MSLILLFDFALYCYLQLYKSNYDSGSHVILIFAVSGDNWNKFISTLDARKLKTEPCAPHNSTQNSKYKGYFTESGHF